MTLDIDLEPMSDAAFARFMPAAVSSYAMENVASRRWPSVGAEQRSAAAFAQLLPQGAATPGHHLFEVVHATKGVVGSLWYAQFDEADVRQVHVYDVLIAPEHRGCGYASAAFARMESQLRAQGVNQIGLHVFAHNPAAQALYLKLGYQVTSVNMLKHL